MSFSTGAVGTATPALDVVNAVEALLADVANGYVLVETFTAANGWIYRVWRNPAANNQSQVDWFLVLGRSADTANQVQVQMGERYDAVAHVLYAYPPFSNTLSRTIAADGTIGDNHATAIDAANSTIIRVPLLCGSAYAAFVNKHYVLVSTNAVIPGASTNSNTPTPTVLAGCYDTLVPASAGRDVGLCLMSFNTGTNANAWPAWWGASTREFGFSSPTGSQAAWTMYVAHNSGSPAAFTPVHAQEGWTGKTFGGRLYASSRAFSVSTAPTTAPRGLLKDQLVLPINAVTPVWGDAAELNIDGVIGNWFCIHPAVAWYASERA